MWWLYWLVLGLIQPFDSKWSVCFLHSSSFCCDILWYLWYLTGTFRFNRSIWGWTTSDPGVYLGIYWGSFLVSVFFFSKESLYLALSYSGLRIYSSPAIICGYNYANGLASVFLSRIHCIATIFIGTGCYRSIFRVEQWLFAYMTSCICNGASSC